MRSRSSMGEVWIGFLVIGALAGLLALVGLASDGPGFLAPQKTVNVVFRDGQGIRVGSPVPIAGLERVMGKDARSLMALFGTPDQDMREQSGARRLQFASSVCVLDAYLYPPGQGAEAVVTYVDARMPNGEDVDRASCVAALSRRKEAR